MRENVSAIRENREADQNKAWHSKTASNASMYNCQTQCWGIPRWILCSVMRNGADSSSSHPPRLIVKRPPTWPPHLQQGHPSSSPSLCSEPSILSSCGHSSSPTSTSRPWSQHGNLPLDPTAAPGSPGFVLSTRHIYAATDMCRPGMERGPANIGSPLFVCGCIQSGCQHMRACPRT